MIAGPTAGGKSGLALALAARLNGVIINADASQLYADLRVLTARPDVAEETRVPHRLYGVADGALPMSAADWASLARAEIAAAHAQGRLPILVGGTGMYLETLLHGIAPVPEIEPLIRADVRTLSTDAAATALAHEDPAMAARLRPTDRQRIARALEVMRSTGQSLAHWHGVREGGIASSHDLRGLVVAPPREIRRAAATSRLQTMIEAGALTEVERLLARNLVPDLPVMKALGVAPLAAHLQGRCTLAEAVAATLLATHQYQKRQMTWARGRLGHWPWLEQPDTEAAITSFLPNKG